jgi:hypothetical protein
MRLMSKLHGKVGIITSNQIPFLDSNTLRPIQKRVFESVHYTDCIANLVVHGVVERHVIEV